jgi:hypothetical protein
MHEQQVRGRNAPRAEEVDDLVPVFAPVLRKMMDDVRSEAGLAVAGMEQHRYAHEAGGFLTRSRTR